MSHQPTLWRKIFAVLMRSFRKGRYISTSSDKNTNKKINNFEVNFQHRAGCLVSSQRWDTLLPQLITNTFNHQPSIFPKLHAIKSRSKYLCIFEISSPHTIIQFNLFCFVSLENVIDINFVNL